MLNKKGNIYSRLRLVSNFLSVQLSPIIKLDENQPTNQPLTNPTQLLTDYKTQHYLTSILPICSPYLNNLSPISQPTPFSYITHFSPKSYTYISHITTMAHEYLTYNLPKFIIFKDSV